VRKTNYLSLQGLEKFKLSRREFFLCSTALTFSSVLHAAPVKHCTQIENAANTMGIDPSTKRMGEWMRNNIVTEKSIKIVKDVEERLKSTPMPSKNGLRGMISNDYLQGRTVDISSIRFSTLEVALCITASTYSN